MQLKQKILKGILRTISVYYIKQVQQSFYQPSRYLPVEGIVGLGNPETELNISRK